MKQSIRISIFLFPWEIDKFQATSDRLKLCANFLKDIENWEIIVDVTLNISDKAINWNNSQIKEDFFINSFNNICKKLTPVFTVEKNIETTNKLFGCVDKRRESFSKPSDYIMWLDTDIFFPTHLIYSMIQAIPNINHEYFVLCPQILKLWDGSWDVLTNEYYINEDRTTKPWRYPNREIFECDLRNQLNFFNGNVELKKLDTFKFAGGWCILFSKKLLEKINIPSSFGSYGLEDTFVMEGCNHMKYKKYDISQYILKNIVIGEHHLSTHNYENYDFKNLLNIVLPPKEEQKQPSIDNYNVEIEKLFNKL